MLRFLGIRHLAVIDQLEVEFEPGLNILTGETGAGKSILVESLDLLIGGRASADLVRTGEELAIIQAVFERTDQQDVIVRREISAQGRSRGFIDDVLATSGALRELGGGLIDLHGQHEHQALLDPADHILHLDACLSDARLAEAVELAFGAWRAALVARDRSQLDDREKRARIEMASFQLHDITSAAPQHGEDHRLQQERTMLANIDRLSRLSGEAYAALYEGESSALPMLAVAWKRTAELAELDDRFAPFLNDRSAIKSTLEDLAFFLRSYVSDLEASPTRLQDVEDRLATLERLKKKYGPTLDEVLARRDALERELGILNAGEEGAARLDADERRTRVGFLDVANRLSGQRIEAARTLGSRLEEALGELAMPHARVDLRVTPTADPERWTARGIDNVEFFLSPNPGEELRPLARIASGGELSRIMLALRALSATGEPGHTLVFDEVDAGIGGAAADAVGARLESLARRYQVLCITHLPQIAARRGAHFHLSKKVTGGRTSTAIRRLDPSARELEIGRMIAGAGVSAQVLASARELLQTRGAGESESNAKGESPNRVKAKGKRGA